MTVVPLSEAVLLVALFGAGACGSSGSGTTGAPSDAADAAPGPPDAAIDGSSSDGPARLPDGSSGAVLLDASTDDPTCVSSRSFTQEESRAYFPYRPGNRWLYVGSASGQYAMGRYRLDVRARDPGPQPGVLLESEQTGLDSTTPAVRTVRLDDTGFHLLATNDIADPRSAPRLEVPFPLQVCSSFEQGN